MSSQITKKRTSFELAEWENVRELMPRKRATRGIQYEALEYLFEHLYEKISEEELREHFLRVKGRLQEKGDPVKSAINLAIKELQRLNDPKFDIIKIQEASLVGKTRRYVRLNYTGLDTIIPYEQLCAYLQDMLYNEDLPIIRSIFNIPRGMDPIIFPGIQRHWLKRLKAYALVNSDSRIDMKDTRAFTYFIPESQTNQSFLLLYEQEDSELPFLVFVSGFASTQPIEASQYIVYRGEDKKDILKFYHDIWHTQREMALDGSEVEEIWRQAEIIAGEIQNRFPDLTTCAVFKGLLGAFVREHRIDRLAANPS